MRPPSRMLKAISIITSPACQALPRPHIFGCVRFTLDVWEGYIGQPLVWHFRDHADRLEISLLPEWDNAQYGYGFLEAGSQHDELGRRSPFSLDFDVIAHEVGHAIISPYSACRASARISRICRLPGILLRLRVADRGDALPVRHRPGARPDAWQSLSLQSHCPLFRKLHTTAKFAAPTTPTQWPSS